MDALGLSRLSAQLGISFFSCSLPWTGRPLQGGCDDLLMHPALALSPGLLHGFSAGVTTSPPPPSLLPLFKNGKLAF